MIDSKPWSSWFGLVASTRQEPGPGRIHGSLPCWDQVAVDKAFENMAKEPLMELGPWMVSLEEPFAIENTVEYELKIVKGC